MNLDRTFCSGTRCPKAKTCERWTGNLKKWIEEDGQRFKGRPISVANFADHDGACTRYEPIEQENEK